MPKPHNETPRRFKRPTVQPDGDSRTRLRVSRRRGFTPRVPSLHGEPEFPRVRRPMESYGRDRQKMASGTSHRTPSVAGDVPVGYGGERVCGGAEGSGRVREEGLRMPGDRGPWLGGSVLWGGVATPFAYFRWQPGCRTSSAVTGTSQPPPPRAHCRRDPLCPRQHAHLLPAWAEPALRPGSRRPWHARPRGSAHSACRRRGDGGSRGGGVEGRCLCA